MTIVWPRRRSTHETIACILKLVSHPFEFNYAFGNEFLLLCLKKKANKKLEKHKTDFVFCLLSLICSFNVCLSASSRTTSNWMCWHYNWYHIAGNVWFSKLFVCRTTMLEPWSGHKLDWMQHYSKQKCAQFILWKKGESERDAAKLRKRKN